MDAASLAITLCKLCIQGYRSFQSLKSLGADAQVILSKIEIQEYRLQRLKQTLETIKQTSNTRDLNLVIQPVRNALESIKLLTTDATHLRTRYKLKVEINCPEYDKVEVVESDRSLVGIRKPHVFKWLLFDKANMDKLAGELKDLTDGLETLLALVVRHELPSTVFSSIKFITESQPSALAAAVGLAHDYPELAADAERVLEQRAAEGGFKVESPRRTNVFEVKDFSTSFGDGQREVAMLAATRELMLLEWRPLPPEFENRERAITRLATISTLLQIRRPAAMRTLDCPGYVINREGRAALVYRFPSGTAREAPISLLRLLEDVEDNAKTPRDVHRPSLNDRYALALALAETVFRLHMSGWLHRCIGSHNVLFFSAEAGLGRMLVRDGGLKRPFLTGFEFSREEEQDAATETVLEGVGVYRYRHPGCQGPFRTGFKKVYDLYGLGMTLLEVGLWKPFDRPPQYKSTISASENRDRILEKCLNGYLAHYTGNTFQAIVRTCLTGDFGCNASDDAALQQSIYDAVVEPLKWLVAGQSREPPQLTR